MFKRKILNLILLIVLFCNICLVQGKLNIMADVDKNNKDNNISNIKSVITPNEKKDALLNNKELEEVLFLTQDLLDKSNYKLNNIEDNTKDNVINNVVSNIKDNKKEIVDDNTTNNTINNTTNNLTNDVKNNDNIRTTKNEDKNIVENKIVSKEVINNKEIQNNTKAKNDNKNSTSVSDNYIECTIIGNNLAVVPLKELNKNEKYIRLNNKKVKTYNIIYKNNTGNFAFVTWK